MSNIQLAQLIVQCVSAIMVLAGLLFTTRQLRLLAKTYIDLHDWNRRKAAQDASHQWQEYADDAVLLENTFHFRDNQGIVDLPTLLAAFRADAKAQASLHRILNYFEAIANGTRNRVFDEPIIRDAFCGVFDLHSQRFGAYIEHRRSHGAPKAWIEMEDLSRKWTQEDRSRVARESTGVIRP